MQTFGHPVELFYIPRSTYLNALADLIILPYYEFNTFSLSACSCIRTVAGTYHFLVAIVVEFL